MVSSLVLVLSVISTYVNDVSAQASDFKVNPSVPGGGGTGSQESARFKFFNKGKANANPAKVKVMLNLLESAHDCWTGTMGWRSSGYSYNSPTDTGPKYKMNAYAVATPKDIGDASGVMGSDAKSGHAFINVVQTSIDEPRVTVHEYGHALTYYERNWVDQGRTGTWWEPVAEYFADTYITSEFCAASRAKFGIKSGSTIMNLQSVLSKSHLVLVDGTPNQGQYYESWPFLAYMTYNPDKIPGLGKSIVRDLFRKYKVHSDETPLHTLARISAPTPAGKIVANYWGRLSHGEIGHPQGRQAFLRVRAKVPFTSLDTAGAGSYKIKTAKAPAYMGSGIHPIKGAGSVNITIKAAKPFTALVALRSKSGVITLVDLPGGAGGTAIPPGDEANLIVVNTPKELILYNGFEISKSTAGQKLDYQVHITGATF